MISKKGINMKALIWLMEEVGVNNYKYVNKENVYSVGKYVTIVIPDSTIHGKTHTIKIIGNLRNGMRIRRDAFINYDQISDLTEHLCDNKSAKWDW